VRRWSDAARPRVGTWPEHFAIDEAGFDLDQTAGTGGVVACAAAVSRFVSDHQFLVRNQPIEKRDGIAIDQDQACDATALHPPTLPLDRGTPCTVASY
jgi:hypothetical protein